MNLTSLGSFHTCSPLYMIQYSGLIQSYIWLGSANLGKSCLHIWGHMALHQQLLARHQLWWGIPLVLHVYSTTCNKCSCHQILFLVICPIRKWPCATGTEGMDVQWLGDPFVAFQQFSDQYVHLTCGKKYMCLVMSKLIWIYWMEK